VNNADDRATFIQDYLHKWASDHGVTPPFPRSALKLTPGFRLRSDADTTLALLERAVRPTVDFLREAGREADLRRVLGLD
jgi:hypothetical protein